jgi:hypothetical protein
MLKELHTNRSSLRRTLFLLLAASLLTAIASAPAVAQSRPVRSEATNALRVSFGSAAEAVTTFDPYYLKGDFNGDGVADFLIVIRITGRNVLAGEGVRIVNPFSASRKTAPTPMDQQPLSLAIIHGARSGKTARPTEMFLLSGESPILILENDRATSGQTGDRKDLMQLIRKRGQHARGAPRAPTAARGDAILLGTEAADGILYWDGKTYRWHESEGGE